MSVELYLATTSLALVAQALFCGGRGIDMLGRQ